MTAIRCPQCAARIRYSNLTYHAPFQCSSCLADIVVRPWYAVLVNVVNVLVLASIAYLIGASFEAGIVIVCVGYILVLPLSTFVMAALLPPPLEISINTSLR